jgi:hypothetical protein
VTPKNRDEPAMERRVRVMGNGGKIRDVGRAAGLGEAVFLTGVVCRV